MTENLSIALFSHDSLGLGHIRRNRALAFALAAQLPELTGRPVSGLLIAGSPEAARFDLPTGWDWMILPGVTPANGGYAPRALASTMEGLRSLRSAAITAVLDQQQPDLFIVDRHPFGIDGELAEALDRCRVHGTRTVLGLREVLDDPSVIAGEWDRVGGPDAVARAFDEVWVYGDPEVYDPRATGEVPAELARLTRMTGYLSLARREPSTPVPAADPALTDAAPFVLTCLGGGSDGAALAERAILAAPPAGHRHLVVVGPQMATAEVDRLTALAPAGTSVVRHSPDMPGLIARAEALVCMGGYNTMAEVMATRTPVLVIPRVGHRQEQPRRAAALTAAGALDSAPLTEATPEFLRDWFGSHAGSEVSRDHIDRDGLRRVPVLAAELLSAAGTLPFAPAHPTTLTEEARCAV
ncbi:glycosyltransferase family protein [Brevibacterium casei]|uniref:Predicted glycosyl transferase n=1 Tax=Brevibacterium casei CIP 102111 TaxID=1255625 RepID=A0A2H1HS50_9MICO|nr:glycosyltransferase [Brevibacterium casei]QPR38431.1 glycosyl transferase [Brevibacterium casei]QPR42597.1 glycosyl transferase [Brevibacterium casei]SMX65727.1 Predicted glycosyl transferase [Brevibacterium casei CIP 102111]